MNDQFIETNSVVEFYDEDFDKYEVNEFIQQTAKSAKNFALVSLIVSGVLFLLIVGSFVFAIMFPSGIVLAILTLPIAIACAVVEILLLIGAIVLNVIALINAGKQQKEFKLYNDGPEKDKLESTIKLGRIFTYIGAAIAGLALILILPLNIFEFLFSIA